MFIGACLLYFNLQKSFIFKFIAIIDACAFVVSIGCAVCIYLITEPVDSKCLDRDDLETIVTHFAGLGCMIGLAAFQLIFRFGGWRILRYLVTPTLRLFGIKKTKYYTNAEAIVDITDDRKTFFSRWADFILIRDIDPISFAARKFFDRWAFFLLFDIALWTQAEYIDFNNFRTGCLGLLAAFSRAAAILGFTEDCYKLFCGQIDGLKAADVSFHSGLSIFRERWSHQWISEVFFATSFVGYFAYLLIWYLGGIGSYELPELFVNYSNLLLLGINLLILITLVDMLVVAKRYEVEIRTYSNSYKQQLQQSNSSISYSTVYLSISRIFDIVKMLMFTQYMAIIVDVLPVAIWAFPSYRPNPISTCAMYILGWNTPLIYEFVGVILKWFKKQKDISLDSIAYDTQKVRRYMVFFTLLVGYGTSAFIGAYRGCEKVKELYKDDVISESTAANVESLFLFIAKAFAIPTTFGFGMVFVTSPSAARYSDNWHNLPFALKVLLAPMPWLTPHLMNELHVASGTIFFSGGIYHALCWIVIVCKTYLQKFSFGFFFAAATGPLMIIFAVKLLWPPGMYGLSSVFGTENNTSWVKKISDLLRLQQIDTFLKESKYGSYHVYIANTVFVLYISHATVNLYPEHIYYWTFPVICWSILFVLHPSKGSYFASKLESIRSKNVFSRIYQVSRKDLETLRAVNKEKDELTKVDLHITLPTYDPHFLSIYLAGNGQVYDGFCDVIMIKVRPLDEPLPLLPTFFQRFVHRLSAVVQWIFHEAETVHYYSVVNIKTDVRANNPSIIATLMIQNTNKPKGSSAALTRKFADVIKVQVGGKEITVEGMPKSTIINENEMMEVSGLDVPLQSGKTDVSGFEVIGFVKSNALESLHAPRIIAFGWESGAAAFCSLLRRRSENRFKESQLFNPYGDDEKSSFSINNPSDDVEMNYSRDLIVVWCQFSKERSTSSRSVIQALEEIAGFQKFMYESSNKIDNNGTPICSPKILFIVSSVPVLFTPDKEVCGATEASVDAQRDKIVRDVHNHFNFSSTANQSNSTQQSEFVEISERNSNAIFGYKLPPKKVSNFRSSYSPKNNTFVSDILQSRDDPNCWLPMKALINNRAKDVSRYLQRVVKSNLLGMHIPGNNTHVRTLFLAIHDSDDGIISDFKYDKAYSRINKAIIEIQLQFLKNPEAVLAASKDEEGFIDTEDPPNSYEVAADVLYSGEYKGSKLDQLRMVVEKVQMEQLQENKVTDPNRNTIMPRTRDNMELVTRSSDNVDMVGSNEHKHDPIKDEGRQSVGSQVDDKDKFISVPRSDQNCENNATTVQAKSRIPAYLTFVPDA